MDKDINDINDILKEKVEIPDIVQQRADEAFDEIRSKAAKKHVHRKRLVFIAVAAAAVVSVSAAAAYINWSRGFDGELRISDNEKGKAVQTGLTDFPEAVAENNGVKITAQQSIVDNNFAYISLRVEGFGIEQGEEPGFDGVCVKIDGNDVDYCASFYDGLTSVENGRAVMEDGSPIPQDADGREILKYAHDDGSLEYIINAADFYDEGLIGRDIHIELENLGVYKQKAMPPEIRVSGKWVLDWTLKGSDSIFKTDVNKPIGNTSASVKSVEISPISLKVTYGYPKKAIPLEAVDGETGERITANGFEEPPYIVGVRLKDGTILTDLYNGPGTGGYLENDDEYVEMFAVNRILDADEIDGILFVNNNIENGSEPTEDDLYVVDIR